MKRDTLTVGKALAHDSAARHVQGNAAYVDDILEPEGCLHLAPGLADNCHAAGSNPWILKRCAMHRALFAVLTASDIPGVNDCSPSIGGDPILAEKEIFFHGQVIFAVVAETRKQARHAAALGKIEYSEKKPLGARRRRVESRQAGA